MDDSKRTERPPPDADASEIAEWMEADFWRTVADRIEDTSDEDEHEVIKVNIINQEQNEVVGTIDTDGNLETESEALKNVSQEYIEWGIPVLIPTTYDNDEAESMHVDSEVIIEPGTEGFVRAFVDELPSPFDCRTGVLSDLPINSKIKSNKHNSE